MKICFYHQTYPKPFDYNSIKQSPVGGTQSTLINIAHQLRLLGLSITICNKTKTQVIQGVQYQNINNYLEFVEFANSCDFDIVIYVGPELEFASQYVPLLKAKKKLMWAQNGWHHHSSYNNYDTIVCVSNSMRFAYGYLPIFEKLVFIHNGIEPDFFPDSLLKIEKQPQAIFVGSITLSKGLHHILRSWQDIKTLSPSAELLVAGSAKLYGTDELGDLGVATPYYENNFLKPYLLDSQGNMRTDIHFLGSLSHSELSYVIASCRVALVNPNWKNSTETCCNAALEAQASGIPVVGVNQGSLPEVIRDGQTGLIVYKHNDQQYAQAVASLLNDPVQSQKLGQTGRNFMLANFTYQIQAQKWFVLLDSLLKEAPISSQFKYNWYRESPLKEMVKFIARKTRLGLLARQGLDNYRNFKSSR